MNPGAIEPILRTPAAANDSALLLTLMALLALNLLPAPTLLRSLRIFFKQLFHTRREAMPGEKTLGERLVVASAIVQTLVFEALILYCTTASGKMPPLASIGGLALLTLAAFLVQYTGYALTGYAFSHGEETRLWLSTFMLTQAMAGFLLLVPAMGALFYPRWLTLFTAIAIAVYVLARIPLFIREFRIFYTSPASLVYFFLYLCTLEIVPFLAVLGLAGYFSTLFC